MTRRLLALLLAILPPVFLGLAGWQALLRRVDVHLTRLQPIAVAAAQEMLQRPVSVKSVRIGDGPLTLARIREMLARPDAYGQLSVTLEGLTLGLKPDEAALAGLLEKPPTALARVGRATLAVSLPALLGGKASTDGIARIELDRPEALLVRLKDGSFPIQDILPKKEPPDYTKSPFQTLIEVKSGRLRFLDLAAKNGERVADNSLESIEGYADLLGTRQLRYALTGRAAIDTPTAQRLTGSLALSGSASRGPPGVRPDSPDPRSPRFIVALDAAGADAAYWLPYILPLEPLTIRSGRADLRFTSVGPRGESFAGPHPPPILQARARFVGAELQAAALPELALSGWQGSLQFDDDRLSVDAGGSAAGAPATLRGTLFNLRKDMGQSSPSVVATLEAPSLATAELLRVLKTAVPKELTLPESVALSAVSVRGPLTAPEVSGRISAPALAFAGWPGARDLSARARLSGGTLRLDDLTASVAGGGTLSGRLFLAFATPATDGKLRPLPPEQRKIGLAGHLSGVPLKSLALVRKIPRPWSVEGRADADFVGEGFGTALRAWVDVEGVGVRVASQPVRRASARLELSSKGVGIEGLRVESDRASLIGGGKVSSEGVLGLRATASGVDLGWVLERAGRRGASGLAAAKIALDGPASAPRLKLTEIVGMNLRLAHLGRTYALDAARCAAATFTASDGKLALDAPLLAERFPASAKVEGKLTALNSHDPKLDLRVETHGLELDEALRQALPPSVPPTEPLGGQVAATIQGGQVRVSGTAAHPIVEGSARLGEILLGPYPVESGTASFRWDDGGLLVKNATLLASIGELEGSLRMAPNGRLSGRFEAPELNLESLSFLTESVASLAGKASASLVVSGTRELPVVTARIRSGSFAEVAGAHLTELTGQVRLEADVAKEFVRFVAPQLAFRQAGARVTLTNATFEPATKRFSGKAVVSDGQLETVLTTLRRSRLDETEAGQEFIDALNQLPAPLDGRFSLTTTLAGRVKDGVLLEAKGGATLRASDVTLGPAAIRTVSAEASLIGRDISLTKLELVRDEAIVDLPRAGKLTLPAKKGDPLGFDMTFDSPETNLDLVRAFLPRFTLLGKVGLTLRLAGDSRAPRVTASLEGQNLALMLGEEREFPLSRLSFIVNATRGPDGRGTLVIDSGRVEHQVRDPKDPEKIVREDAVSFDATLPLETVRLKDRDSVRLAGTGPLQVSASIDKLGLDTLSAALGGKVRASGTLSGKVQAGGTLKDPQLGGQLALDATEVRLPKDLSGGDVLNPITRARLALALEGSTIRVSEGMLALGAPGARQAKESFGTAMLTGSIRLDNLAELPALLEQDPGAAIGRVAGEYDLSLTLAGLRPVVRNVSALLLAEAPMGMGEAITGRLSGTVRVTGKTLLAPRVASEKGPLQLSQALFLLPVREGPPPGKPKEVPLFNPTFDVDIAIPTDATVANQSRLAFFEFKSRGDVHIGGDAFQPEVLAELTPTGGKIRYPLAPAFRVKKQGSLELVWGSRTPRLSVRDIEAEGTVSVRPGSLSLAGGRLRDSGSLLSAVTPSETSSRYKITLAFDGPLDVFGVGGSAPGGLLRAGRGLTATADPPLPGGTEQILRLLGADAQLSQLASGDAQGAILSTLEQVSSNVVLDSLLDPFNKFILDAFGLSDFNINYFPDGTAIVQASAALGAPLERFSVNLTRTIQTRARTTPRVPALLSLTYDVKSFGGKPGKKSRYVPRLQLGVSNDDQRLVRYFLRGTVSY